MNIILHLPWPPTVNHYYSHTKFGVYISKKGKQYRKDVEEAVREQSWTSNKKLTEAICVKLVLHPPDDRARDVDNYNKSLLDALSHAEVWEDDYLIDQLFIYRGRKIKQGKVIVIIEESQMIVPVNSDNILDLL